jgi:hypothetical protein
MADEEFEIDGDEDYEVIEIDPQEDGRIHDKWVVVTAGLDLMTNVFADVSDFFGQLGRAASQHALKKIHQREFHEVVARELETLPLTTDEEDDDA